MPEAESVGGKMMPISDALDSLLVILDDVIEQTGIEETDAIVAAFDDVRRVSAWIR